MSISFSPSVLIVIANCVEIYNERTSDAGMLEFWSRPEQERSLIVNVCRAYARFRREFAHYDAHRVNGRWSGSSGSPLSAVREYHRLLLVAVKDLVSFQQAEDTRG